MRSGRHSVSIEQCSSDTQTQMLSVVEAHPPPLRVTQLFFFVCRPFFSPFFLAFSSPYLQGALHLNDTVVPQPPRLQLTAEKLTRDGTFLMDCGNVRKPARTARLKVLVM